MKTTTFKALGAFALAGVLSMATGAAAFAADNTNAGEIMDHAKTSTQNTVSIKKEMIFINDESSQVREPAITYTYTLSAVTGVNATVTDSAGMSGKVKDGVSTAITNATDTIQFLSSEKNASSAAGEKDTKYADFTFDATKFSAPGIYRYKIVETTNVTKASVGVTEAATYNNTRYLDVYVKKNTDGTAREIYGYTLYEMANGDSTTFNADADPTVNIDKKSSGYVNTKENPSVADPAEDVDVYKTHNYRIHKTTTGQMADTEHSFPLAITYTKPASVTANVPMDVTLAGGATLTGTTDNTITNPASATVKDGSVITLTGVPEGAQFSVVETNDTPDSYKVKAGATSGAADLLTEAIVNAGSAAGATTAQALTPETGNVGGSKDLYFTNTLDIISPTGIAMRFAPYVLMVIGGVALIVLARRGRSEQE